MTFLTQSTVDGNMADVDKCADRRDDNYRGLTHDIQCHTFIIIRSQSTARGSCFRTFFRCGVKRDPALVTSSSSLFECLTNFDGWRVEMKGDGRVGVTGVLHTV